MNQVGCRIIYDQDGEIIYIMGEMQGSVLSRKEIQYIGCLDLNFGAIDFTKNRIVGINAVTQEPILEVIEPIETEEQRRIRELEDALLLATDAQEGGIL